MLNSLFKFKFETHTVDIMTMFTESKIRSYYISEMAVPYMQIIISVNISYYNPFFAGYVMLFRLCYHLFIQYRIYMVS